MYKRLDWIIEIGLFVSVITGSIIALAFLVQGQFVYNVIADYLINR